MILFFFGSVYSSHWIDVQDVTCFLVLSLSFWRAIFVPILSKLNVLTIGTALRAVQSLTSWALFFRLVMTWLNLWSIFCVPLALFFLRFIVCGVVRLYTWFLLCHVTKNCAEWQKCCAKPKLSIVDMSLSRWANFWKGKVLKMGGQYLLCLAACFGYDWGKINLSDIVNREDKF